MNTAEEIIDKVKADFKAAGLEVPEDAECRASAVVGALLIQLELPIVEHKRIMNWLHESNFAKLEDSLDLSDKIRQMESEND